MTDIAQELESIEEQIAQLARKKAELLERTRSSDLETCRRLIKQYGFSKSELGLMGRAGAARGRMGGNKAGKYANPANPSQVWNGHGRRPGWYSDALARGVAESSMLTNK